MSKIPAILILAWRERDFKRAKTRYHDWLSWK